MTPLEAEGRALAAWYAKEARRYRGPLCRCGVESPGYFATSYGGVFECDACGYVNRLRFDKTEAGR